MPSTMSATNPHNVKIDFYEDSHKYTSIIDGKEVRYTSVSTLAGKYFPKFESEKVAGFTAKKEGVSIQEILNRWKLAGEEACLYGTRVHQICEDTILGVSHRNTPSNEKEEIVFEKAKQIASKFKNELDILGVEKLVFNEKLKIAGTIDLFARSKKDGSYLIIDWKTNKTIDTENQYGKKGLYPIECLDDTNYIHYALQLSLYEYILKHTGYINTDANVKRILVHLNEVKCKYYDLPSMEEHVKNIILEHIMN